MLKVSSQIKHDIDEEDEETDLNDFKGIYYNDNNEQRYYENGAHFKYKDLCIRLERLVFSLPPERRGKSMYEDWEDEDKEVNNRKEGRLL